MTQNTAYHFLCDGTRGCFVTLAEPIASPFVALGFFLAHDIKNGAYLTIQCSQGKDIESIVVDIRGNQYRAYSRPESMTLSRASFEGGICVMTFDLVETHERSQAVTLMKESVVETIEDFFKDSFQIETSFQHFGEQTFLILQRLPGENQESFIEACMFAKTISEKETHAYPPEVLIERVFSQLNFEFMKKQEWENTCFCSQEHIDRVASSVPDLEEGTEIKCEFCKKIYKSYPNK
jgi:redox-regulated HSP33 family molecular chaperone